MAHESSPTRSRRAILGAALGAGVAAVASALGRPTSTLAADGNPVVVGGEYSSSSVTSFHAGTSGAIALQGFSDSNAGVQGTSTSLDGVQGSSQSGAGVYGFSTSGSGVVGGSGSGIAVWGATSGGNGVRGSSQTGYGVWGSSDSNIGVLAGSDTNNGVWGVSSATDKAAILGLSAGSSTAVQGYSGPSSPPSAPAKTGVYGYAGQDGTARGVIGESPAGQGVRGLTTSGIGVRGFADSGVAASFETTSGMALVTKGRVRFQQIAGKASLASGASQVTVTPGVDLTSGTSVLASLNGDAGGSTTVKRIDIDTTANSFTVHLTAASTATINVAWFVLDQ